MASISDSIIDESAFKGHLGDSINRAMLEAAEPILQDSLKMVERRMREKLASTLIALIESNFVMERRGYDILITVKQAIKPSGDYSL